MDAERIHELFAPFGQVTTRRMFGGLGIYHNGLIIAVVVGGDLLLKADEQSSASFEQAGGRQWAYERADGKAIFMPYWSVPPECLDEPDLLKPFADHAYEAAIRSEKAKSVRKSRP